MSLMELMRSRRAMRSFERDEVRDDVLLELVEAGIWAPSGSNVQPWHFIIVKQKSILDQIFAFSPGLTGSPPVVIVVCTDRQMAFEKASTLGRDEMCVMDICMASQNIMLAATDKGLATCPVRSFNKAAIRKILRLPSHISPDLIISVGYASKEFPAPRRKGVSEVTHFDTWEGAL